MEQQSKLNPECMARVEAWEGFYVLMQDIRRFIEVCVDEALDSGVISKAFVPAVTRFRQMMVELIKQRRAIILTPLPGDNAASKLARGVNKETMVTYTVDDLLAAVPDVDYGEHARWAKDQLNALADLYSDTTRVGYWNELKALVNFIFTFDTTPRGVESETAELRAARLDSGEDISTDITDWED